MQFSTIIGPLFDSYNNMVSTASHDEVCRSTLAWLDQHCSLKDLRPGEFSTPGGVVGSDAISAGNAILKQTHAIFAFGFPGSLRPHFGENTLMCPPKFLLTSIGVQKGFDIFSLKVERSPFVCLPSFWRRTKARWPKIRKKNQTLAEVERSDSPNSSTLRCTRE